MSFDIELHIILLARSDLDDSSRAESKYMEVDVKALAIAGTLIGSTCLWLVYLQVFDIVDRWYQARNSIVQSRRQVFIMIRVFHSLWKRKSTSVLVHCFTTSSRFYCRHINISTLYENMLIIFLSFSPCPRCLLLQNTPNICRVVGPLLLSEH